MYLTYLSNCPAIKLTNYLRSFTFLPVPPCPKEATRLPGPYRGLTRDEYIKIKIKIIPQSLMSPYSAQIQRESILFFQT